MTGYLTGIFSAFSTPITHAGSNILDSYLANRLFTRLSPLIWISCTLQGILLPVVWFLDPPHVPAYRLLVVLFLAACIDVLYQFPYYWSLRRTDTSLVASLFSLGKIFVPLLAFYFLGEQLSYSQYIGFFIIIIASVFLTFDRRRMRLNTAFWLMLVVSIVLAFQSVLIKYAYDQGVGWGTSIVWMTLFQWILATLFLLAPSNLAALNKTSTQARKIGFPFVGMVLLDWSGTLGQDFALYLLPVSIVKGIGSTQPLFALVYAILFSKKYPQVFREYIDRPHVRKKLFLFLCIIIGTLLVVW